MARYQRVESRSPTRSGLRAVLRTPSIWLAEVAWRWAFAAAAGLLVFLCLFEFLNVLPISESSELLLRSGNLVLISRALSGIFQVGGRPLLIVGAILAPALTVLWLTAAAWGRAATLKFLLAESVARDTDLGPSPNQDRTWRGGDASPLPRVRSLLALNFLRVVTTLAAVLAWFGLVLLAGRGWAAAAYHPGHSGGNLGAGIALFISTVAIGCAWAALNWILALAAIFAGGGRPTAVAIADALTAVGQHAGRFLSIGIWFGLLRLLVVLVAIILALLAAGTAAISAGVAAIALFLVLLLYFALADFLHVARLAAYVAIVSDSGQW